MRHSDFDYNSPESGSKNKKIIDAMVIKLRAF